MPVVFAILLIIELIVDHTIVYTKKCWNVERHTFWIADFNSILLNLKELLMSCIKVYQPSLWRHQ